MNATSGHHLSQRLKVGAIGLALVAMLIVVAGTILGSVTKPKPAPGRVDLAANIAADNATPDEPLAAMGVAPLTADNKSAPRP